MLRIYRAYRRVLCIGFLLSILTCSIVSGIKDRYNAHQGLGSSNRAIVSDAQIGLEVATSGHFAQAHGLRGNTQVPSVFLEAASPDDLSQQESPVGNNKNLTSEFIDQKSLEQTLLAGVSNVSGRKLGTEKVQLSCDTEFAVKSLAYGYAECPGKCPIMGQIADAYAPLGCHFVCQAETATCGTGRLDPLADVLDTNVHVCRRCSIPGCNKCGHQAGKEVCQTCGMGYRLNKQGRCESEFAGAWIVVFALLFLLFLWVMAWYIWMRTREVHNEDGLQQGLRFRTHTKLHRPADELVEGEEAGGTSSLYPLNLNFQSVEAATVAGPGTVLHFNFLLAMIVWPVLVTTIWVVIVFANSRTLFDVGRMPAVTVSAFCGARHWGSAVASSTADAKVGFNIAVYLLTVIGSIVYCAVQIRRYEQMDDEVTMRDYALLVKGLPVLSSGDMPEERYKEILEEAIGKELVGVSICWNYYQKEVEIAEAAEKMLHDECLVSQPSMRSIRGSFGGGTGESGDDDSPYTMAVVASQPFYLKPLVWLESKMFRLIAGVPLVPTMQDNTDEEEEQDTTDLLQDLSTSGLAFAVFKTEAERAEAIAACEAAGGFSMRGNDSTRITLEDHPVEPFNIKWGNFGVPASMFYASMRNGFIAITLALVFWTILFYLPYAYYMSAFSYARGERPSYMASTLVSMLVVMGNQAIYFVCSEIADRIQVYFTDTREVWYMLLYTLACFLNTLTDLCVTGWISYKMMLGLDIHIADGAKLEDVSSLHDILEDFSMQKTLGAQMTAYCFPSTFFVPYVIEPVFAIAAPKHIMRLMVRRYPWLRAFRAQRAMSIFTPMDAGRYGDALVNVYCAVTIFFLPAGYCLFILLTLSFSHAYIYIFDQYRILRCVPRFTYSSATIDTCAQTLMAVPCGFVLMAAVWNSNCSKGKLSFFCLRGASLWLAMIGAFFVHIIMHISILWYVVPRFAEKHHEPSKVEYEDVATNVACSWFSANPVHCLRSKFIHRHDPPCVPFQVGKEHLQRANPANACYYEKREFQEKDE